MAASLNTILEVRKLTQAEAARLLGVNQPKVSALTGYKLEGFSVERLMHFATALQHDEVIEIRPHPAAKGAARVMVVGAELDCSGGFEVQPIPFAMRPCTSRVPKMVLWWAARHQTSYLFLAIDSRYSFINWS